MTPTAYHSLECKNKASRPGPHTFRIPPPKLLQPRGDQSESTIEISPANFACPHCRHVYEYTALDVVHFDADTSAQYVEPMALNLFVAELRCGATGCRFRVIVYTPIRKYETRTAILERLAKSTFHISCKARHTPLFPNDVSLLVRAEETGPFDPF